MDLDVEGETLLLRRKKVFKAGHSRSLTGSWNKILDIQDSTYKRSYNATVLDWSHPICKLSHRIFPKKDIRPSTVCVCILHLTFHTSSIAIHAGTLSCLDRVATLEKHRDCRPSQGALNEDFSELGISAFYNQVSIMKVAPITVGSSLLSVCHNVIQHLLKLALHWHSPQVNNIPLDYGRYHLYKAQTPSRWVLVCW